MSKITEYLQQILSARYGRDVRQSIHDSIKELDEIATTAQDSATANAQTAISKASEALTASQEATQKAQEALESAEQAKMYADNAEAVTGVNIATQDKAGLVKGGDIYIDEDGALVLIKETTESSMPNSHAGRLKINEIGGVMEQGANPSPTNQQEIRNVAISGIRTIWKNLFNGVDQHYYLNGGCNVGGLTTTDTGFVLKVSGGKYTVSTKVAQTRFRVACANELGIAFNCFNGVNKDNRDTVTSITIDCTGYSYLVVNATDLSAIQVEEGTEATPYEPYTESSITFSQPIELYGKDDVRDILTSKQIKRKFKKFVFDGTENITLSTTTTGGGYYFRIALSGVKPNIYGGSKANALCTRLTQYTPNYLWENDVDGFSIDSQTADTQRIRFRLTSLTDVVSVDALKAKLAEWYAEGNPLAFVLELAEETTEEIPIADQIALNSLQTFDGITYVEFIGDVQPTFKAEYGTSKVGGYMLESLFAKPVAHEHNQLKCGGYTLLMQEDGNLVLYSPDGAPLWDSESDRNKGKIDLLCDFTGTSETIVDLSDKGHIPSRYSLIIAELYGPDGVVGSTTFPAGMAAADGLKRYVYGSSAETWGRVGVGDTNITCNRTSATTTSMKVYGIR